MRASTDPWDRFAVPRHRSIHVTLPSRPQAVTDGRHLVASTLAEWDVGRGGSSHDAPDDVLVVATELLANAATICTGTLTLSVAVVPTGIRVTVDDDSPQPALLLDRPLPDAPSGRGLAIVHALASSWGQTPYQGGTKSVWAEVAVLGSPLLVNGASADGSLR